jgi:hypothetical protein
MSELMSHVDRDTADCETNGWDNVEPNDPSVCAVVVGAVVVGAAVA